MIGKLIIVIAIVGVMGCSNGSVVAVRSTQSTLSATKMPRSQATGDIFPIAYTNPWGIEGLGSSMDQGVDFVSAGCTIGVTGYIVGSRDSFSTKITVLNIQTGWDTVFYKVGLNPGPECIVSGQCKWYNPDGSRICPPDSFLIANHLWCMVDSTYDEYYNRYPTRPDLLDTLKSYQYAVYANLNMPQTVATFDPRKSVGVFGFNYIWSRDFYGIGEFRATYDTTFITQPIISKLKNIKP